MVLSSISPLFVLWAIRGIRLVPDCYFIPFCAILVVVPYSFLWLRIVMVQRLNERVQLDIGEAEDHRDHLLVYLFTMLLPFYFADLGTWRDAAAVVAALGFVVFLFWHLNLHYMNVLFAVFGFRVFTIYPQPDNNPLSGNAPFVLITRRVIVPSGMQLEAYRLSDTVYLEVNQ